MEGCGGGGGFSGDGKGTKQRATRDQLKLEKWHEMERSRDVFIRAVVNDYKDSAPVHGIRMPGRGVHSCDSSLSVTSVFVPGFIVHSPMARRGV